VAKIEADKLEKDIPIVGNRAVCKGRRFMVDDSDVTRAKGVEERFGDGGGTEDYDARACIEEGLQAVNVDEGGASIIIVCGIEDVCG
jgi:hypothetical protein